MAFVELLGDINKEHRQCTAVGRNPIINAFILSIAWHITNNSIKKKKLLKLFKKKEPAFFSNYYHLLVSDSKGKIR